MNKTILLAYLLALALSGTAQAKDRVWLCDCQDFKATVTITDKYFELVHHTKSEIGDFVWQRVNYKETAGDTVHPRYVENVYGRDYVKISQLKESMVEGVQYFTFESAELYPSSMILITAQDTRYSQCVKLPVKNKK